MAKKHKIRAMIKDLDQLQQKYTDEQKGLEKIVASWTECPPVGEYQGESYDFYNGEDERIEELNTLIQVCQAQKDALLEGLKDKRAIHEDVAMRRGIVKGLAKAYPGLLRKKLDRRTCEALDERRVGLLLEWEEQFNVITWIDAFRKPALKGRIQKMFSEDRSTPM